VAGVSTQVNLRQVPNPIDETRVECGFLSLQPYRELFGTASNLQDAMDQVKAQAQRGNTFDVDLKGR
jgi:hypothetical protein